MDKLEMVKAGVVALVRYTGSLQGYTHKNPMTGNTYVFAGPNVFTKVYDLKDAEFYESKESFEVEMLVIAEEDVVLEAPELVKEEPEEDKDEADGEDKDEAKDIEPVKKEEPKEKPSQSKSKDKPKNKPKDKPKGKGGVK